VPADVPADAPANAPANAPADEKVDLPVDVRADGLANGSALGLADAQSARKDAPVSAVLPADFDDAQTNFTAALRQVGARRALFASEDIHDTVGVKLWAKGKPIDDRLWERLVDRRLRHPLETSVGVENPVGTRDVIEGIERLVLARPNLALLAAPHLRRSLDIVRSVSFNSTEMTLLTVLRDGQREMFEHACAVTAVALSLAVADGERLAEPALVRAAMLHDAGEIYINPRLFASQTTLTPREHRQLSAHPVVGALVARGLARVDETIVGAIEQSHERLNGSGYPAGRRGRTISALARPLLTAEAVTTQLVSAARPGLRHAAIALRLVPGEFPSEFVALVNALRGKGDDDVASSDQAALREELAALVKTLEQALAAVQRLDGAVFAAAARAVVDRVREELGRCQWAMHATGMTATVSGSARVEADPVECEAVLSELRFRFRHAARELQSLPGNEPRMAGAIAPLIKVLSQAPEAQPSN